MTNLKTCPECNGRGFVAKWDTRYRPTILSKCDCVRCGGSGSVKSIGMSPEESLEVLARAFGLDIVMPVRCYECRFEGTEDCPMVHRDPLFGGLWSEQNSTGYCNHGERKDDD